MISSVVPRSPPGVSMSRTMTGLGLYGLLHSTPQNVEGRLADLTLNRNDEYPDQAIVSRNAGFFLDHRRRRIGDWSVFAPTRDGHHGQYRHEQKAEYLSWL